MPPEDQSRTSTGCTNRATLANSNVVSSPPTTFVRLALDPAPTVRPSTTPLPKWPTSTTQVSSSDGMPCVRGSFSHYHFSEEVTDILIVSWGKSTRKQFATYVKKWMTFCRERQINCYSPLLSDALQFLLGLFNQRLSYSTLDTARSALSTIVTIDGGESFGSNHIVTRFMKGVSESHRSRPKYDKIWDVSVVLKYLYSLHPNETLSLKDLTHKVLMLVDTLPRSTASCYREDTYSFDVVEHIKSSTPRSPLTKIDIAAYEPDNRICPLICLQAYIKQTKVLRNTESKLFISYVRPHKPVTTDTISRWTRKTLRLSRIDAKVFTAHSTRSVSVSKANEKDVPVHEIIAQARSLQRPSVNITTNRLSQVTALLVLFLTSETSDMFLEYCVGCFAYFISVRLHYKHGYHCLRSTPYLCVDFMPLVRVYVVWVHLRFKLPWDLCLPVMW